MKYVEVDFEGWRYFELLLRERDAAAYHDYQWPYGAHCVLHRSPLVRHVVSKLTLYLNNLPPQDEATCSFSTIKALRTRKVVLHNPTIEIGGNDWSFPSTWKAACTSSSSRPAKAPAPPPAA